MTGSVPQKFSQILEYWLKSPGNKTYSDIQQVFKEKSFAVVFILLMVTAALPLPTGGITHVFEAITMLLAVELIIGRKSLWLPKWWIRRPINPVLRSKALPKMVSFIKWFERWSRPRLEILFAKRLFLSIIGVTVFLLSLAALLAVPFSGLDTLPALGVVLISLSMIVEDALLFFMGTAVGAIGIILELALGVTVWHFL